MRGIKMGRTGGPYSSTRRHHRPCGRLPECSILLGRHGKKGGTGQLLVVVGDIRVCQACLLLAP